MQGMNRGSFVKRALAAVSVLAVDPKSLLAAPATPVSTSSGGEIVRVDVLASITWEE